MLLKDILSRSKEMVKKITDGSLTTRELQTLEKIYFPDLVKELEHCSGRIQYLIDQVVELWHVSGGHKDTLSAWLGMTDEQYSEYVAQRNVTEGSTYESEKEELVSEIVRLKKEIDGLRITMIVDWNSRQETLSDLLGTLGINVEEFKRLEKKIENI